MLGMIMQLVIVSLAVATVSLTMTRAIISKPLRTWLKSKNKWLGELFSCPYCFSHWVSFGAILVVRPTLTSTWYPVDLLISALAVTALASMWCGLIFTAINATAVPGEH